MMHLEARIARAVIFSMTDLPISLPLNTFRGTITAFVRHDSAAVDDMAAIRNCREQPEVIKKKMPEV
jgi:hypothetical protein